MKPVVSIITPTFNFEKYIDQCIETVIGQSFKKWEMIIIDDRSTDKTVNIIKSYIQRDKRIKLIQHKKNWGVKRLKDIYNQALKISKGEYIAILEGDDFWPSYKLERQINSLRRNNAILSFGDAIYTDELGRGFDIVYYPQEVNMLNNDPVGSIIELFLDLNFYLVPVTVVIKKDALLKIGGFQSSPYYYFVDLPTWLRLAIEGHFIYEREIMGFYRRHKESSWLAFARQTKAMIRQEMQNTLIWFFNKHNRLLQKRGIQLNIQQFLDQQYAFILKKWRNRNLSLLLHSLAYGDRDGIIKNIKSIFTHTKNNKIKLFAGVSLFLIFIRKPLMVLFFEFKYVCYKLIYVFNKHFNSS